MSDKKATIKKETTKKATKKAASGKGDGTTLPAPASTSPAGVEYSVKGGKKADARVEVLPMNTVRVLKDFNPRKHDAGGEKALDDLCDSIKKDGLISAILVRPDPEKKDGYTIVAGERRYRAMKKLGRELIPAIIRFDLEDDLIAQAVACAENSEDTRTALDAIDFGEQCQKFADAGKWSVAEISARTGTDANRVRRCMDLVSKTTPEVQARVRSGDMPLMGAVRLANLEEKVQKSLLSKIDSNMSAQDITKLVKDELKDTDTKPGVRAQDQDSKESRAAGAIVWRSRIDIHQQISRLSYMYLNPDAESISLLGVIRGSLSGLLWVRGDIDYPMMESMYSNESVESPEKLERLETIDGSAAEKKDYKRLVSLVETESAKHDLASAEAASA